MNKKVLVLYPKSNYIKALNAVGITPEYNINNPCDGLLLTGGGDVSPCAYNMPDFYCRNIDILRDQTEFFIIEKYLKKNLPIMGVCRGLQVVNVFMGGSLKQHIPNHCSTNKKDIYHKIFTVNGTITAQIYGKETFVASAHHQAAEIVGEGLKATSYDSTGIIESLEGKNILLVQFHPERMGKNGLKLYSAFKNIL